MCKEDWDSYETSWDFQEHPLVKYAKELWNETVIAAMIQNYYTGNPDVTCPLELCYLLWMGESNERYNRLKSNEEELNNSIIEKIPRHGKNISCRGIFYFLPILFRMDAD
jgi:hypothetical protein